MPHGSSRAFSSQLVNDGKDFPVCEQQEKKKLSSLLKSSAVKSAVPWCMKPLSHSSTPRINASSLFLQSPCTRKHKKEGGGWWWRKKTHFQQKEQIKWLSQGGKTNKKENMKQKETQNKGHYVFWETTPPPPPPNSLLCSSIQEPWGHQSHTAKIRPRQQSVAALEVPLKGSCPGSKTFIWTTICTTRMHTCEVCHWFCGGRHICFISLLSSWTGLSICRQQSLQSTSIKPNCQTNPAFLSLFPFSSDGRKHHVSASFLCCTIEVMSHNTTHIRI